MVSSASTSLLDEAHPPASRTVLTDWLSTAGITVHPNLDIEDMEDGSGWCVAATQKIGEHELLFSAPKAALLSTRTSSLRLPDDLNGGGGGGNTNVSILSLALCVLHELRLGTDSRWYGYLQSLPRESATRGLLPTFWPLSGGGREASEWLEGTDAENDLDRRQREGLDLDSMRRFYKATSPLLPPTPAHSSPSPFSAFVHAYTLLSTRAFLIDLYHAAALVPFADILNHSSSPHTSLACDDFVCHRCGSMPVCEHDALLPGSQCPARLAHLDPVVRDRVMRARAQDDTVEMRAERVVGRGCEVWNTYGEMGDARLLVEYGFLGEEFAAEGLRLGEGWADEQVKARWKEIMEVDGALEPVSAAAAQDTDRLYNAFEALALTAPDRDGVEIDAEDTLVTFTPAVASSPPHLALFLSHSAQISFPLFALAYLASDSALSEGQTSLTDIRQSLRDVEQVYAAAIQANEDEEGEGSVKPVSLGMGTSDLTRKTARAVRDLLAARLQKMHRPDATLDGLFDIKDSLESESRQANAELHDVDDDGLPVDTRRMKRLALTLSINERVLLFTARDKWATVVRQLELAGKSEELFAR